MATAVKQNGSSKVQNTTVKKDVQQQLAKDAIGKLEPVKSKAEIKVEIPHVNLDDRIQKFEKLRGLANNRERLVQTLNDLTKFNYNQGDSSSFYIRDASGMEFKTTNTNLIRLVSSNLQTTLEERKS
ncbi:MAG: hypothetical protein R2821_06990 [Flavobacteriaceae bacterium]